MPNHPSRGSTVSGGDGHMILSSEKLKLAIVIAFVLGCSSLGEPVDPIEEGAGEPQVRLIHLPGFEIAPKWYQYFFLGRSRPEMTWDLRISADGRVERRTSSRGSDRTHELPALKGARLREIQELVEAALERTYPVRELPEHLQGFYGWCPGEDMAVDVVLIASPEGTYQGELYCDGQYATEGPVADLRKTILDWYPAPRVKPRW